MQGWNWRDSLSVLLVVLAGALLVIGGNLVAGCAGWLETTCAKVQPVLNKGPVYLADAEVWFSRAEALEASLPADKAAKLGLLVDKGRIALAATAKTVDAAVGACSEAPDWLKVFADVVAVVVDIEKLIAGIGGNTAPRLARPLVMTEGGK